MTKTLSGGVGSSFHIISSPQVQLDRDTATSQVMWSVVTRAGSGQAALTMIGRHRDELVREDGHWKIARRRGFVDLPTRCRTDEENSHDDVPGCPRLRPARASTLRDRTRC
jgi:hypothetical protein